MTTQARQPEGIPVGGQFAATAHSDPAVTLHAPEAMTDSEFARTLHALSEGNVSASRNDLPIEGVRDYWSFDFNNEDELSLFVVVPEDGDPFSVVGYGIHTVTYPDGDANAEVPEGAPPARTLCSLYVPDENRRPVDPGTLAQAFRSAGRYANPEWADEDEDTGDAVWEAVHGRLAADLGVPGAPGA
jgi:hypothetical protein